MRQLALLAAALAVAAAPDVRAETDPALAKGLLAVLEFRNKLPAKDRDELEHGYFADQVRSAALRSLPGLRVITRENLVVLLQSTGRRLEECEGECEVDTGRRIGADLVVSGDLLRIGTSFKLNLRLHETKTGQLLNGAVASGKTADDLDAHTAAAVAELLQPLREAAAGAARSFDDQLIAEEARLAAHANRAAAAAPAAPEHRVDDSALASIDQDLGPAPAPAAPAPAAAVAPPPPAPAAATSGWRTAGWVMLGVGVSAASGGVFQWVTANNKETEAAKLLLPLQRQQALDEASGARTRSIAFFTLAGLAGVAGAILVLTHPSLPEAVAVLPAPAGVMLAGRF